MVPAKYAGVSMTIGPISPMSPYLNGAGWDGDTDCRIEDDEDLTIRMDVDSPPCVRRFRMRTLVRTEPASLLP